MITREESLALVNKHVKNENLVNHMVAVGAIMKGLAEHYGEDPQLWEATGILHDVDYENFGEDFALHGAKSAEMVKDLLPEDAVNAILRHNPLTGNIAETRFDIALLAADAISGMIVANALVRPNLMEGMKAKSINKRMKDKSFARQVSRENIMMCEDIGLTFSEFATIAIKAMQEVAPKIGLA
ncbi:MAG: HD domain-containing protein [Candidatus Bathyarchaeota archaeon]|nr:HD domain-containing protein [Candidatus Bathyarchaeota archaeon]